jgi:ATP-dependent helicase HrpB
VGDRVKLPVDAIRDTFEAALAAGPVVLTAPTGSGKSTRVPVWLAEQGPVVVVEPRRIAARALGGTIASQMSWTLGEEVGWVVRDDVRATRATRLRFVTPGVALRMLADGDLDDATVVLDEFHERTLDIDLLLALLARRSQRLVLLSATLDAEPLAAWLGGTALHAEGRRFPVEIHHQGPPVPTADGLEGRVVSAVRQALQHDGDVLVFLPGKGEIAAVARRLDVDAEVVELHGGLSLAAQRRAIAPSDARRVVLATNVAETSLTVPGIRVVVDSGLVRQTRYHRGRAHLALVPVALDSADQRAGRAGRLAPGTAIRLWGADRHLEAHTPPEVHRESLVSLVLAAAVVGVDARELSMPDPPKGYALDDAFAELDALGAVGPAGLTERGRRLFGLPVDPALAQLLVVAEARGTLEDVVDLVAAVASPRPLFRHRPEDPDDDLSEPYRCDGWAAIRAIRHGERRHGLDRDALAEARTLAGRLREVFGAERRRGEPDRRAVVDTVLAAWPHAAFVPRRRKRHVAWANGGTEVDLGRSSVVSEEAPALVALELRAFGVGRQRQLRISAAMPVPVKWLAEAGIGRERVAEAEVGDDGLVAVLERVHAGTVLGRTQRRPEGEAVIPAVVQAIGRRRLFKGVNGALQRALAKHTLAARLELAPALPADTPEAWLAHRLEELGVADVDDLALLDRDDLLPPELPSRVTAELDERFPSTLDLGTHTYALEYEPAKRTVTLVRTRGPKGAVPPARYLPRLQGWRVLLREASNIRVLRERR